MDNVCKGFRPILDTDPLLDTIGLSGKNISFVDKDFVFKLASENIFSLVSWFEQESEDKLSTDEDFPIILERNLFVYVGVTLISGTTVFLVLFLKICCIFDAFASSLSSFKPNVSVTAW